MKSVGFHLFWCCVVLVGTAQITASLELPDPALEGSVMTASWTDLGSKRLPSFAASDTPWPAPIPAQSGTLEGGLRKTDGSGYTVPHGIYAGNAHYHGDLQGKIASGEMTAQDLELLKSDDFSDLGTYRLTLPAVPTAVKNLVLQIRLAGLARGQHFSAFELTRHVFPVTLTKEDGDSIVPTLAQVVSVELRNGLPEEIYLLRWDFSKPPSAPLTLNWKVYPHSLLTGLRVDVATEK